MKTYKICEVKECERIVGRHGAKGFCPLHYRRYKLHGDPYYTPYHKKCSVVNCNRIKQTSMGYCKKHGKRYNRGADPQLPSNRDKRSAIDMGDHALIPLGVLAKNGYAIVDKEDMGLEKYLWSKGTNGYAQATVEKSVTLMHHLVQGKPNKPLVTDHINRNKVDNRKVNLRFVTERENALNKRYGERYDGNE